MAVINYSGVGMSAIAACVPPRINSNYDLGYILDDSTVESMIKSIGIKEKRFVDPGVCTSDLCFRAAERLLDDGSVDRSSIDMVIFLSMTPDYIMPPTSSLLQHRLGLPQETACLDLSLACSGFVYALSTAFAFASSQGVDKVLVLVGESMSHFSNPRDRVNFPLYGDAGTACLVEKGHFGDSTFILTAGGEGEHVVLVPHGGHRFPITDESLIDKEREDGNFRRDADITMDGLATFNHAVTAIPKQVKQLLEVTGLTAEDFDYLVSHQANKFMIDFIVKRLKFDVAKVPFCLEKFGNTSAASIPLTIVSELHGVMEGNKHLLLSAIGAGWSFGTAHITTQNLKISKIFDY